jgi:heterotetrameric sarcosine oxidase gamma subunit
VGESAPNLAAALTGRQVPQLAVRLDETVAVAALRYFESGGAFALALREASGATLPGTQAVTSVHDLTLAWRSPTETWCLAPGEARLEALAASLAGVADGQLVNLTGGVKVLRVSGARTAELLCRLGGSASVPPAGETRRTRLAEVPVQTIALDSEVLLAVERVYAAHLLGWIRETLADLE